MKTKLTTKKDGSVTIHAKTTPEQGNTAKAEALRRFAPQIKLDGFRAGAAPVGLVESQIKPEKLAEETISILSGMVYQHALEEHKLEPISQPALNLPDLKDLKEDDDPTPRIWPKVIEKGIDLEVKVFQKPEIELGKWEKIADTVKVEKPKKTTKKKDDEPEEPPKTPEQIEAEFDEKLIETLIEKIPFELAQPLINGEAQHLLQHQLDMVKQLGVSFEDFLKSQNKKPEDLEKELQEEAEKTLRIRFILADIAAAAKLPEKTTFKDVLDHVKKAGKKDTKKKDDTKKETKTKKASTSKKSSSKEKETKKDKK